MSASAFYVISTFIPRFSLDDVKQCLDSLKSQSVESFGFVAQARASLADVRDLRNKVDEAIDGM